jgi:putative chitinase
MSVSILQQNLIDKGYDVGIVDGKLGALTFQGLAEFVTSNVAPDGTGDLLALVLPRAMSQRLEYIHFFAQVAHESGFKPQSENLNYSAAGLRATFSKARISDAQCQQFGRSASHPADKVAIGNTVYGGTWGSKNLGNTQPGDGYKYRGRGLIQLTGRANYHALGLNYEINPDLLLTPAGSIAGAVDFWTSKGLNALADTDSVPKVTLRINGGDKGLAERTALTNKIKAIWPA